MSTEVEEGINSAGGDTARYFNSTLREKKEPAKKFDHKAGTTVKQEPMRKQASVLGRFVLPVMPEPVEPMPEEVDALGGKETADDNAINGLLQGGDLKSQKPAVNVRTIMGIPDEND